MGKVGTEATLQLIKAEAKAIHDLVGRKDHDGIVYGFHIDQNEADPYAAVTYVADAEKMFPAYMDFITGEFNYGDWEDAFFMPKPCMLKYDGTVDYYLDPDDYTKKEDGTPSDVANTSYGGNAMMEWGQNGKKIWMKIVPEDTASATIYIADHQEDAGYTAWPFIDANGDYTDHFYTPIYNGSNVSGVLRSMSGLAVMHTQTSYTERAYAKANNSNLPIWDIEVWCDIMLINMLIVLIGKSLNTQKVFGEGASSNIGAPESIINTFRTGIHNNKGLFYGTNDGTCASNSWSNCVKIFGMENWWGFQQRRLVGIVNDYGTIRYKMTRSIKDGTTVSDYVLSTSSSDYNGKYITGPTIPSAGGAYIKEMNFTPDIVVQKTINGSASTYYCDAFYTNNSQVNVPSRGGSCERTSLAGTFCLFFSDNAPFNFWGAGAAPSCKPLAASNT